MAREINQDVYRKEWQWQEGDLTVTRTTAWSGPGCHDGCGVLYYTDKEGKLVKVEGDPNNPYNQGALCMRCLDMCEAVYHKDRLLYPMKRDPKDRGLDKWERISWDEAYDLWKEKVDYFTENYGAHSIIGQHGTGRNVCQQAPLVTNAGCMSPNHTGGFLSGDSCYSPRTTMEANQFGDMVIADMSQMLELRYDDPEYVTPECIVIWGNNCVRSNSDGFLGQWVVHNMKRGSKLIVIDPQITWLASMADYVLQIRPGTDAALAMAWLHVIVEEDLYDHDFVENWCNGFDEMCAAVKDATPEWAAEVCWLDADEIRAAARFYANAKPAAIQWGLKIDQQISASRASIAIGDLWTITGNLDVPGGNIIVRNADNVTFTTDAGFECIPNEELDLRIGVEDFPFRYATSVSAPGEEFESFQETEEGGYSVNMAHTDSILETIETEQPYPIKMTFIMGGNWIANMAAEAPRVYEAMKKLEFVVVADLFMTPTMMGCADLVLPATMSVERYSYRTWWTPLRAIWPAIAPLGEAHTDEEIVVDAVNRFHPENSPADTALDWIESKLPCTLEQLRDLGYHWPAFAYKKYEKSMLRPDGQPGFATWNGKADLVVWGMERFGLNGAPAHDEPSESPVNSPELYEQYPYVLLTGARSFEFFHSEHRQLATMREFHPEPLVTINVEDAAREGIKDGDWVWIENHRGRCRQVARVSEGIAKGMVSAEHGWWKPEDAAEDLYSVFDYNINNLTTQCDVGDSGYGAPYTGLLCKIYKCTPENSEVSPTEQVLRRGGFNYERKHLKRYEQYYA